jgi:hypothetical protein
LDPVEWKYQECEGNRMQRSLIMFALGLTLLRAGIAKSVQRLGYWMDNRGVGIQFLLGSRDFSLLHTVQDGSEAHPVPYPVGTGGLLPRVAKRPGRESDHSLPSSAEFKKGGAIPPPRQKMYSWYSASLHGSNFRFF